MAFIIATAVLMAFVAAVIIAFTLRNGWLYARRRHGVVVHTIDDQTISGVLASTDRDGLVLVDCTLIDDGVTMKGDIFVPRNRVRFIQVMAR